MASQEKEQIAKVYRSLFDPERDPILRPGYVSTDFSADPAQQAQAALKLAARQEAYAWRPARLSAPQRDAVADCLRDQLEPVECAGRLKRAAMRPLPFYNSAWLVHLFAPGAAGDGTAAERVVVYQSGKQAKGKNPIPLHGARRLTGKSADIFAVNAAAGLKLTEPVVEEYLAFFDDHLAADGALFLLIEHDEAAKGPYSQLTPHAADMRDPEVAKILDPEGVRGPYVRAEIAQPITLLTFEPGERAVMIASVAFRNFAFRAAFGVSAQGFVDMLDDTPVEQAALTEVTHGWLPKPEPAPPPNRPAPPPADDAP
ncbi:MAG: hypothetical protein V4574_04505 [Pseudomonadota bacterium]